jgi:putative DNA primase/helicase
MPINQAEAQAVTLAFVRDYPGALDLAYRFRDNTGELYGHRAAEVPADLKGGYVPKETIHNGRAYRGRVDVPLANMDDAADLVLTLRHEVLGHYGANTFKPAEKRALLDGLIAACEEPSLKPRWEDINRRYAGASMDVRAEEVWALHCESIAPGQHVAQAQVLERGQQSFMETCIARVRPMQVADLHNIVCMVADGLHDRSRTQQTFPQINELFRRDEAMEPKKPFHEVVAEKLIEQLKAGTAPWQRPWEPGKPNAYLPMNPTTGKRYKGINAIHLMAQGRSDGRWMTYKQAAAVGAQVRKGEKGTPIQSWKFSEEQNKVDESGRPVLNAKGEPVKETVQLERPRVFFATVFNAEQIDGLPPIQKKEQTWSAVERAEHILKASGASITHAPGDRAFYRPATDSIHLPDRGQFPTADNYYATALHELGHWTGHPSRLDRDLAHPFGSEGYAKEELRAEIASMIVGDELGIGHDPGQHAAYVGSWIKALQDEPLEVFRAAADAEKIHDYVLAFEQKQVQEQEQAQVQQAEAQQLNDELREHGQEIVSHLDAQSRWADGERIFAFHEQDEQPHQVRSLAELESYAPDQLLALPALAQEQEQEAKMQAPEQTDQAEAWMLKHVELGTEGRALEGASYLGEMKATLGADAGLVKFDEKVYINVPFKEKDEAKSLGARWDRKEQSWYVPAGVGIDTARFEKWAQGAATPAVEAKPTQQAPEAQDGGQKAAQQARPYLAVPYEQRNAAKAAGALWDKAAKSWYAGPRADMAKLERWKPENVQAQQGPAMTPREEFAEAMRSAGLFTGSNAQGDHPIMDGTRHRVPVEGGKKGALDGFYVGHLDGHPAGRIINNKTGTDITWKSKGYALSDQEKAKLQAEAAEKLAQRAAEQDKLQEATAQRVGRQMADLVPVEQPTPYLQAKGIEAHAGVFTDREGQKTYIPAFDADGKQWTMQYIQEDGTKRFAKDSKKEGCFHPVGGMDALSAAPALVIAEGYATATSLAEGLGHATVAAFDSGNLPHVARSLREKFPDKPIVIAGDDDKAQEIERGHNPGRAKAEEAAKDVGGKAIFPIFAPGEQQANPKGFTDFNDLANKSELGRDGLKRQVGAAVGQVLIEEGRRQQQDLRQERAEKQQQQPERPRRATRIG